MWSSIRPLLALVIAIPVSLLPRAWRRRFGWDGLPIGIGSAVAAAAQIVIVLVVAAELYRAYQLAEAREAMHTISEHVSSQGGNDKGALMGLGLSLYLAFVFTTKAGLLCFALFVEALVRLGSAPTGEPPGLLGLWLIEKAREAIMWCYRLVQAPPLSIDLLTTGAGGFVQRIETCRRRGWSTGTIIRLHGRLYSIGRRVWRFAQARPHLYHVSPLNEDARPANVIDYAIDELLPDFQRAHERHRADLRRR